MGGHGALVLGLRNPDKYRSISAFSAICNPVNAPWGKKAFSGYLGDDKESWKQYDATELAQVSGVGELPGLTPWTHSCFIDNCSGSALSLCGAPAELQRP